MSRNSFLILIFLLIMTGCEKALENKMPEEMPSVFSFSVRFGYGEVNKNEINTFQNTFTKDLIMNGTATTEIIFTKDEMRSIYEEMREVNIMGAKDLVPSNNNCSRKPFSEDSWELLINGQTKTFSWSDKYCEPTSDAKQLLELRKYIQKIVESKEAYLLMPKAKGGYD